MMIPPIFPNNPTIANHPFCESSRFIMTRTVAKSQICMCSQLRIVGTVAFCLFVRNLNTNLCLQCAQSIEVNGGQLHVGLLTRQKQKLKTIKNIKKKTSSSAMRGVGGVGGVGQLAGWGW
jgi:hypothetical protein